MMVIAKLLFALTLLFADEGDTKPIPLIAHHYTSQRGLIFNNINRIALDCTGFIWIATEDGLSRFDTSRESFTRGENRCKARKN